MPIPPEFPRSPYAILDPDERWLPDATLSTTRNPDQLLPPLVAQLRRKVAEFRAGGYAGASETTRSLLNWWFNTAHLMERADGTREPYQFYFAQREAIETVIWLYEVAGARDKHDLMRYDSTGRVSANMFDESWLRLVVKMATGSGKTRVLGLAIVWSFFHRTYEAGSALARNFLLIAPNIIVLDRLYRDFQGLRMFFSEPILPDNGFDGHDWRADFQLTVHRQDDARVTRDTGNIFLTNIHRVYDNNEVEPTADDENTMDYFFGRRPTGKTTDSQVDLGMIVRDVDELMVLNDEAHHVRDPGSAWFKSIQDIHHKLVQKQGSLAIQLDVTATPRHNNGAIFVQTVADYPLVEAIWQGVVKRPVLPDAASRARLQVRQGVKLTTKFADYIELGVTEWRKAFAHHQPLGKKAILFVMTDDTKNCDDLAAHLERNYPDLEGAVLTIHTKSNGEISEALSGKAVEELEKLRKEANRIDDPDSPWKAIVSVMMLKEGWDVRNVTTIVGLRAYSAKANILPEQTLGRGLRKMYPGLGAEDVSIVGTENFMEFVESIRSEGVTLGYRPMGPGTGPNVPLMVEVDEENEDKDLDALDIEIPVLTPRIYREYKNLADLDPAGFKFQTIQLMQFTAEQQREIVFRDPTTDDVSHTTVLDAAGVGDHRSVLGFFARALMRQLRLVSGYDVLYGKVEEFLTRHLFGQEVSLEDANTLRNLSETPATKGVMDAFGRGINELITRDRGDAEIRDTIQLRNTRPFVSEESAYLLPKKSVFNRIVVANGLESDFSEFLDSKANDVVAFAKITHAVGFKLDYVKADGNISNYIPDFLVRLKDGRCVVVETKGREELDLPQKMARLRQWCDDVNRRRDQPVWDFVYVDQQSFEQHKPKSFQDVLSSFREYKD